MLGAHSWVEGDALALPFADNSFDSITLGYGLRNVADIPQCLRELRRVLRPGEPPLPSVYSL
jgi:demethylmenaquinone methyltransferase/2-methoxy-6-polyprenyl-1,4-benzoquinol methylase